MDALRLRRFLPKRHSRSFGRPLIKPMVCDLVSVCVFRCPHAHGICRWSCRRLLSVWSCLAQMRIWLGGRPAGEGSFPLTEVPHLNPDARIFRAALTSRSCDTPHRTHTHVLTASCLRPLGPVREPQLLHARVVFLSLTTLTDLPAYSLLYNSICLSMPQPLSSTAVAMVVLASFRLLTSPTMIV
jgi:hypothetical protein